MFLLDLSKEEPAVDFFMSRVEKEKGSQQGSSFKYCICQNCKSKGVESNFEVWYMNIRSLRRNTVLHGKL